MLEMYDYVFYERCVVGHLTDGILRPFIPDVGSYVVLKEAVSTILLPVGYIMNQV